MFMLALRVFWCDFCSRVFAWQARPCDGVRRASALLYLCRLCIHATHRTLPAGEGPPSSPAHLTQLEYISCDVSIACVQEWGDDWMADAPQELVNVALTGIQSIPDEQAIILSRCYPSKRTAGYTNLHDRQVVRLNGEAVVNLRQMYHRIQV